ncbi:hypothetical protein D3C85_1486340 [compost metagenome]
MFRQERHVLRGTLLAQAVKGFLQSLLFDRFQQIIESMFFKSFDRILIKCGQKNDVRTMLWIEHSDHFQAADARHLDIEKQHVGAQFMHRANGFDGVGTLTRDFNVALFL